jgi:uroporphyrin-III C-methyltransferase/precorrin-2 dehydrogenase/sirohydrochlorin ferrochelatase
VGPQARIDAAIVAEARKGRRVVRLKSGDPGIFGRAGEEIAAAAAAGAALGRSLTERGISDTLVLTTATGREEAPLPDCARLAGPGTTLAIYMGARQADRISQALRDRGMAPDTRVQVCVDLTKPGQRLLSAPLDQLSRELRAHSVTGCTILLATWPAETACKAAPGAKRSGLRRPEEIRKSA